MLERWKTPAIISVLIILFKEKGLDLRSKGYWYHMMTSIMADTRAPRVASQQVSSTIPKCCPSHMTRVIGPQSSDTSATLFLHLPTPPPPYFKDIYWHELTDRHTSLTSSATSSLENDWARDSFSLCCVNIEGENETGWYRMMPVFLLKLAFLGTLLGCPKAYSIYVYL